MPSFFSGAACGILVTGIVGLTANLLGQPEAPPSRLVASIALGRESKTCNDPSTLKVMGAMQDVASWHQVTDSDDWIKSVKHNIQIYKPLHGELEFGQAITDGIDSDLKNTHPPDVSPVCRWWLATQRDKLVNSLFYSIPINQVTGHLVK